jgi:hypothetical protein
MPPESGAQEPFDEYLRARLKVELLKLKSLRATLVLPSDLQGPPAAGHGGGAAALLLEMIRMVVGERGGEAVLPRPLRLAVVFHHALPLALPLRAEVNATDGGWQGRILHGEKLLIAADLQAAADWAPIARDLPRLAGARESGLPVPRYEWCLACGRSNPRGAQLRFLYSDAALWQQLTPPAGFRARDGSLALAYLCIVGDELGWWLGALRQGECGLTSRLTVTLGAPIRFGAPLLAVGARSAVRSADPRGRFWETDGVIVGGDGKPVAHASVQFAGSRAFTKTMLAGFIQGEELAAVQHAFPRYAASLPDHP